MSKIKPIADIFEEIGRENPQYRETLKKNPFADTPFGDMMEEPIVLTPARRLHNSQTQREAWAKLQDELGTNQYLMLSAIEEIGPATFKQLAAHLDWSINVVTPRVGELRDQLGLVIEFDRVPDPEHLCSRWALNPERFQLHYKENSDYYESAKRNGHERREERERERKGKARGARTRSSRAA